jgi:hypothetical protein
MLFLKKLKAKIVETREFTKQATMIGKVLSFCFKIAWVICNTVGLEKADEGMYLYGLYPEGGGSFINVFQFMWWLIYDCHISPLLCRLFGHRGEVFRDEKCPEDLVGKGKVWCRGCFETNGPNRSY